MASIIDSLEISCATCHKTQSEHSIPLKQCAKCKTQYYCSREYQKADWQNHKRVCRIAAAAATNPHWLALRQKEARALALPREQPEAWFRGATMDDRDRALLFASSIPFINYIKGSYLRKVVSIAESSKVPELIMFLQYHKNNGQAFESVSDVLSGLSLPLAEISQTAWMVETDQICKQMLHSASLPLIGHNSTLSAHVKWQSMTGE